VTGLTALCFHLSRWEELKRKGPQAAALQRKAATLFVASPPR
jgi:hypothetical protein